MKKLLIGFVFLFTFVGLTGCVGMVTTTTTTTAATTTTTTAAVTTTTTTAATTTTTGSTTSGTGTTTSGSTDTTATTTATTTTTTTTTTATTATKQVLDLPDDPVDITFWHIYGQDKAALLDEKIADFEAMYPNVTIEATSQSDYDTLRTKINLGIAVGQVPTMAIGYPDHFAGYITADAVYSLDNFIYSNNLYRVVDSSSTIFNQTVDPSLNLNDFVPSYLAENNQYVGGHFYSVPYSKSTEAMAVNRTVLKDHVAEIQALGIDINSEGFLSHTTPLTYAQLAQLNNILVDPAGTNTTTNQCQYLVNYDSAGNLFINMSRQWNAGYTDPAGDILIDNQTTRDMLTYMNQLFNNNELVLPIAWDQSYGSTNFKYGDVCMSVGSTAGVAYNIPSTADPASSLQFGIFDVDYVQVPQFVAHNGDTFTENIGGTDKTYTGSLSAVQQGPNIGIFKTGTTADQRLYAWLFIKYLISTDVTAEFAMETGYLPARISAYSSTSPIQLSPSFSLTYAQFLQIAQDYWTANGNPGWATTDERWNYLYSSMVANIAYNQNSYYQYDPAFAAGTNSAGSAVARVEAGNCLNNIYTQAYDPEGALDFMINQLTW
jgi:multiple sugar transport system substrate-binding protein